MKGLYYEDFELEHPMEVVSRTLTETDVVLFTGITGMNNPLFLDDHFAKNSRYGQRIVPGILTLGMAIGMTEHMIHGTVVALLGLTDVKFVSPLFFNETIAVHTLVTGKRLSKSNPKAGIIHVLNEVNKTESDQLVLRFERDIMVYRREKDNG
ncbi:MAG: MaoC family dehydratase [Alicyclobacillus macrosporangiidus]|uniref:MaoC family dehydratase n=1 Tax=Alicyclobacillus macrosporangiidus TaxID=392015 RepID=UPI0026F0AB6C|nr:MaoC family dehydratase [Alicyclobacillus macrosporangiidus]MCL6599610.1 MaoC family dehydratase [Alicyclobacillus macrosporangiidus]